MQNLYKDLIQELAKNQKFLLQGQVSASLVRDKAYKLDPELVGLLFGNDRLKQEFFTETNGAMIFNYPKFAKFITNKEFLPDSYTEFESNVGLSVGDKFLSENKEVVLSFPFKDCILEGGMDTEEAKNRKEIFYNQTLAPDDVHKLKRPKALKRWEKYDAKGKQEVKELKLKEDGTFDENFIIKGNNLLALYSLLPQYKGKVKIIYIDPPYNTGSDGFKYNDSFNHSTWLVFMKNRLEIARELLADDGIIIISCDDNEQAYLRILSDEIFNKPNLLSTHHIQVRYPDKTLNEKNDWQPIVEYALIYAKNRNYFEPNKQADEYSTDKFVYEIKEISTGEEITVKNRKVKIYKKGEWEIIQHKNSSVKLLKETWVSGSIYSGTGNGIMVQNVIEPRLEIDGLGSLYKIDGLGEDGLGYRYFTGPQKAGASRSKMYSGVPTVKVEELKNGEAFKYKSIPNFYDFSPDFGNISHEGGVSFNSGKKPVKMLKQFINYHKNKNSIVLDFHAGSGSTAHAVLELNREDGGNRKFVLVEQMDYINTATCPRVQKVIENQEKEESLFGESKQSFIYLELAKNNIIFLEKIESLENGVQAWSLFEELANSIWISYRVDIDKFKEHKDQFLALELEDQKKILKDVINYNHLYVNYEDMEDEAYKDCGLSTEDKALTTQFYEKKPTDQNELL
jgi:adenine-specific DNA-methyltransferase